MARARTPIPPFAQLVALAQLVDVLVRQYGGTCKSFAEAAGMTPSQLSRILHPTRNGRPPSVTFCLKIARAGHCSASRVLRVAGYVDYAALLEDLYGTPAERTIFGADLIHPAEMFLLRQWRTLSPGSQRALLFLINSEAEKTAHKGSSQKAG